MVTGCVSSRLVHECEGEGLCGFYGLPHLLCVPVPPYAASPAEPAGDPLGAASPEALAAAVPLAADG